MRTLHVLYFARLRERFGMAEETLNVPAEIATARDLVSWLANRGGAWQEELGSDKIFRIAVDQELAEPLTPLPAQGEVAVFPPVTGG